MISGDIFGHFQTCYSIFPKTPLWRFEIQTFSYFVQGQGSMSMNVFLISQTQSCHTTSALVIIKYQGSRSVCVSRIGTFRKPPVRHNGTFRWSDASATTVSFDSEGQTFCPWGRVCASVYFIRVWSISVCVAGLISVCWIHMFIEWSSSTFIFVSANFLTIDVLPATNW